MTTTTKKKKLASVCILARSNEYALAYSYVRKSASVNVAQDTLYHRKKNRSTVKWKRPCKWHRKKRTEKKNRVTKLHGMYTRCWLKKCQ